MAQQQLDEEKTTGHQVSQVLLAPGQKIITVSAKQAVGIRSSLQALSLIHI